MARRRLLRSAGLLLAAAAVAVPIFAAVTDAHARARARTEQAAVGDGNQRLALLQTGVSANRYAQSLSAGVRDSLQESLQSAQRLMATTVESVTGVNNAAILEDLDIGTLQKCLDGVRSALQASSALQTSQAAADISAVSGACLALEGSSSSGVVYPFDFPDPNVILVNGTYYAYGTNSAEGNIQIIESTNLENWTAVGNALPALPGWAEPGETWAPAVLQVGNTFNLYYSAVAQQPKGTQCISVATASSPQGPFTDNSTSPLECQTTMSGSIDPSPFVDTNGNLYLLWRSNGGGGQPDDLWSQQLAASGTSMMANTTPTALLGVAQPWENGTIEAPDLVLAGGRYLLFYSGNAWNSANYGVGVASCTGPTGPCNDLSGEPILDTASSDGLGNASATTPTLAGPGGESVFADAAGNWCIAFHAWLPSAIGYPHSRVLVIWRLDLSGNLPAVVPPGPSGGP